MINGVLSDQCGILLKWKPVWEPHTIPLLHSSWPRHRTVFHTQSMSISHAEGVPSSQFYPALPHGDTVIHLLFQTKSRPENFLPSLSFTSLTTVKQQWHKPTWLEVFSHARRFVEPQAVSPLFFPISSSFQSLQTALSWPSKERELRAHERRNHVAKPIGAWTSSWQARHDPASSTVTAARQWSPTRLSSPR